MTTTNEARVDEIRATLREALQGEKGGDMRVPIADLRVMLEAMDRERNRTQGDPPELISFREAADECARLRDVLAQWGRERDEARAELAALAALVREVHPSARCMRRQVRDERRPGVVKLLPCGICPECRLIAAASKEG